MAKRAKKAKFPEMVFVKREYDTDGTSYLNVNEQVGDCVDEPDWQEFAIYKRIGTGSIPEAARRRAATTN